MPKLPLFSGPHTLPSSVLAFCKQADIYAVSVLYDLKAFGHSPFIFHLLRLQGLLSL